MAKPPAAPTEFPVAAVVEVAAVSALAIVASLAAAYALGHALHLGPLSRHMIDHIALLALAAPAAAWLLRDVLASASSRALGLIVVLHIALIWIWHLPPVFAAAQDDTALHVAMSGSLFGAGLLFWSAVIGLGRTARWQAILALLLTGKLFCLFAALLVLSPRLLYGGLSAGVHHHHAHAGAWTGLADQQLAGLIMITVCPLAYVASGVTIAARWLLAIERDSPEPPRVRALLVLPLILLLPGCSDVQSVLAPASRDAESTRHLTWILFAGGTAIFALVIAVLTLALIGGPRTRMHIAGTRAVALGGIALPLVVLTLLLAYGLWLARANAGVSGDAQEITVQGERWWWRVTYHDPELSRLASANEIRVEAGRPVRIRLTSNDVIHSFWVPALAGKVDAIPGRINELQFTADKPGTYRGQCAEYCGGPHALMGLRVVVLSPQEFAEWQARERSPAAPPTDALTERGRDIFETSCVACHAVRGTSAAGRMGPDLTHVASRAALGAEALPMSKENAARWIRDNGRIKPNNLMPEFRTFPPDDLDALAAYIAHLR